jgi:hypothetical protein
LRATCSVFVCAVVVAAAAAAAAVVFAVVVVDVVVVLGGALAGLSRAYMAQLAARREPMSRNDAPPPPISHWPGRCRPL